MYVWSLSSRATCKLRCFQPPSRRLLTDCGCLTTALNGVTTLQVAPAVHGLLDSACDRQVDPSDAVDCRLVVRCAAALVRRHHDLAPERAAAMVVRLAETAGSVGRTGAANRWQRFMALQALRSLLADPSLLYRYDCGTSERRRANVDIS